MATITFELGKPKQDKTRRVSIILSHKGQRKRISTNIIVPEKNISRSGRISTQIQNVIDNKINILRNRLYALEEEIIDKDVSVEWLYSHIINEDKIIDFFEYTELWIERSHNKGKRNYRCMLNSLKRFYNYPTLPLSSIDYKFLNEYKSYLQGHPRAQSLYLGNIRHIFNEIAKEHSIYNKVIVNNPFKYFSVPKEVPNTNNRVVPEETLVKIFNFEGTRRIGMARDCYILSFCLIGMNSIDMYECTSYSNGILSYCRAKTKGRRRDCAYIEIVVPNIIKPLFEKYKDATRVFNFYKKYNHASNFNKHINKGLHIIAKTLGVPSFDFYSARHTWASIARNKLGIDKYTIHEALNHTSTLNVTDIYIQRDFTNINKANAKVIEYLESLLKAK